MIHGVRRLGLAVAMVLVAGCSKPDDDILAAGSQAVVAVEEGSRLSENDGGGIYPLLKAGVIVRVGHDPGDWVQSKKDFEDKLKFGKPEEVEEAKRDGPFHYKNGSGVSNLRDVGVTVESGEFKGVSGKMSRKDLRLVK